ncbi:MAG: hypothetical protein JW888_12795 [Pirellulales bacterium]|nr:hypothetical protein [Pirellulales bacterium]
MTSRRRSFIRKIVYLVIIALFLPLLYWLGHPATLDTETDKGSPGGMLAQQRTDQKLDQVYLGKIDPTSETLKLATLGMRGIAANILWTKGIEYQKKKDWTNLSATLNQIVKLQPNFIDVWRHQGWNLSYNCSAEFDDYRERYHWVIKGIDFLKLGTTYNQREPRLLRDIGWFIGWKIGRADEHEQFRLLFKEDDDFNGARPQNERDNWLVGKQWFRKAENLIDTEDVSLRGMKSPVVFRSQAAMCQMNCADATEKDGKFGEVAKRQWQQAAKDWSDFGRLPIPTTDGRTVHLGEVARLHNDRRQLLKQLDDLAPGVRENLFKEKESRLTDEQRKARNTPEHLRPPEQFALAAEAEAFLEVEPHEIVRNHDMPRENQAEAKNLLEKITILESLIRITESYRGIVNYDYWKLRAEVEQEKGMLDARKATYAGNTALSKGDLTTAMKEFADASASWIAMLSKYPILMTDRTTTDDIGDLLESYGKALDQRDQLFPSDFALAEFVRMQVKESPKTYQIRNSLQKAEEAESEGDLATAATFYEKVLQVWRGIIADLPSLEQRSDPATADVILAMIRKYADVLKKLDRPVPSDFILHQFVRVQMEHDPETRAAQLAIERSERALDRGELSAARKDYEQGFALWRRVLDRYPTLIADGTLGEELIEVIDQYRQLLKRQKVDMPKDFILQDVLDRYGQR